MEKLVIALAKGFAIVMLILLCGLLGLITTKAQCPISISNVKYYPPTRSVIFSMTAPCSVTAFDVQMKPTLYNIVWTDVTYNHPYNEFGFVWLGLDTFITSYDSATAVFDTLPAYNWQMKIKPHSDANWNEYQLHIPSLPIWNIP